MLAVPEISNNLPRAQYFSNSPRLRDTPRWSKRGVAIEDFAGRACPRGSQVAKHRFQESHSRGRILMDAQMGKSEWSEQPTPSRALMVGVIAFFAIP